MSDWELVESPAKKKTANAFAGEWELAPQDLEESEGLGKSLLYAPFRIVKDLGVGAWNMAQNIPELLESGKTEVPAFLNPLNGLKHPVERGKQYLAGALELGEKLNHTPRAISQYAANRLNLIPQSWADAVPEAPSLQEDISNYLGEPKYPGDALLRGLVRNADSLYGAGAIAKTINPMRLSSKSIAKDVLRARERNMRNYGSQYESLWKEAESQGLSDLSHLTNKNDKSYYHGHHEPIADFHNDSLKVPDSEFGKGFWTSPEKDVAESYGKNLHEVKGNFKIFNVNKSHDKELLDLYKIVQDKSLVNSSGRPKNVRPPTSDEIKQSKGSVENFRDALKNKGYEGIERLEWESGKPEVMFFERPLGNKNSIKIDMDTIKKYSPGRGIKGLEDFESNPTLQNAHNAKSDLLRIKRDLDKLTTLRTAERQQLAAVNEAIDSINQNMFKMPNGKIHEGLKQKYGALQEGYKNEVIPYKHKAINEFMRGESSADEMVNALSRKAFYAKRSKHHNAMRLRKLIKSHPYLAGLGATSVLGAGGMKLYKEIFDK